MGKKKVIKQTEEELLKETDTHKVPQVSILPKTSKQMAHGRVYIQATYNNTIVSVTDERCNADSAQWSKTKKGKTSIKLRYRYIDISKFRLNIYVTLHRSKRKTIT